MKVCVTGGCGFIGSHVVDAYVEKGYEVVIVDNLSTGKRENQNKKARLYVSDVCTEHIEEIFLNEKPDIINHHAAQISVPLSVMEPILDAEINIKGTIRLLELSRKHKVKKFIFASTGGAIYGDATKVPTDESYSPEPVSPYAISKLSAERYIQYYYKQYNLPYIILRYSNVYGPRQIPHGEAGVVAIFIEKLISGEHPVLYHFPDEIRGMVRDYCYVKDIAQACMVASEAAKIGIYNIGTGKRTFTLDLYSFALNVLRQKGKATPDIFNEPIKGSARPGEVKVSTLDVKKAREELHWQAQFQLKEGLSETVDWYLDREA